MRLLQNQEANSVVVGEADVKEIVEFLGGGSLRAFVAQMIIPSICSPCYHGAAGGDVATHHEAHDHYCPKASKQRVWPDRGVDREEWCRACMQVRAGNQTRSKPHSFGCPNVKKARTVRRTPDEFMARGVCLGCVATIETVMRGTSAGGYQPHHFACPMAVERDKEFEYLKRKRRASRWDSRVSRHVRGVLLKLRREQLEEALPKKKSPSGKRQKGSWTGRKNQRQRRGR